MFEQQVTLGPGTGTFTQHTLEILIMLLGAFLLGVWLGWMLWNKYKQEADKLRFDVQSMTATLNTLNSEMNGLKTKLAAAETSNRDLGEQVAKLTNENRTFREQLTETSEDLAETEQRNRKLETELGLSFEPPTATPESIPLEINTPPETPAEEPTPPPVPPVEEPPVVITIEKPATSEVIVEVTETPEVPPVETTPAAVEGVTETLEIPVMETPAEEIKTETPPIVAEKPEVPVPVKESPKAETKSATSTKVAAATGDDKDDLTVIEGIGPKIQELLRQYGILTYKQLAETEVTRLKEILAAAGPQLAMHDPGTWSAQANLAANDKWEDLKAYQGFLKGGKTPVNPPG